MKPMRLNYAHVKTLHQGNPKSVSTGSEALVFLSKHLEAPGCAWMRIEAGESHNCNFLSLASSGMRSSVRIILNALNEMSLNIHMHTYSPSKQFVGQITTTIRSVGNRALRCAYSPRFTFMGFQTSTNIVKSAILPVPVGGMTRTLASSAPSLLPQADDRGACGAKDLKEIDE